MNSPMRRCIGWGLGSPKCQSFCPCGGGVCHLPGVDVFAHLEALWTLYLGFYGGFLMRAWPVNSISSLSSLSREVVVVVAMVPRDGGGGLSSDPIRSPPRVTLLELKVLLVLLPLSKGLGALCQESGTETNLHIFSDLRPILPSSLPVFVLFFLVSLWHFPFYTHLGSAFQRVWGSPLDSSIHKR